MPGKHNNANYNLHYGKGKCKMVAKPGRLFLIAMFSLVVIGVFFLISDNNFVQAL